MRSLHVWSPLIVFILAAMAYAERRPLLRAIGGFLLVEDALQPADAIVMLSGSMPDRILETVDLYQAHVAPRIILTREEELPGLAVLRARGGVLREHHEQNVAIAEQLGVPPDAITVMPQPASSTIAEAEVVVGYLEAQGIRSIVLVTSKAHSRRARMTFRGLTDGRIRVIMRPARYDTFASNDWWEHRGWQRRVVIEYGKLLNYVLIDRWRARVKSDA